MNINKLLAFQPLMQSYLQKLPLKTLQLPEENLSLYFQMEIIINIETYNLPRLPLQSTNNITLFLFATIHFQIGLVYSFCIKRSFLV